MPGVGWPAEVEATATRVVYRNQWMAVREDAIRRADGSTGIYGVVDKPDFALIVPVDGPDLYLVEQYRYPVGARCWEFPQGSWEHNPGADLSAVAYGELAEETGLRAGSLRPLGRLHSAYGFCSQGCTVFIATELEAGRPSLGPEEAGLTTARVSRDEFEVMVRAGRVTDAASLAAYALLMLAER